MSEFRTDSLSCEGCPLCEISMADCLYPGEDGCREVKDCIDKHDKQIIMSTIEECIDILYEVTPQTNDEKLDMVFVNALKKLKE